MPNQREIAQRAGLTQATVSMALRNHPAVNAETRAQVQAIARQIGYRPNPLVSSLMAHIRSGRRIRDQGCLAVIVGASSREAWLQSETFVLQHQGIRRRAEALGYHTECFFDAWTSARLNRVLHARGIQGVVFAAPQHAEREPLLLRWERFACASVAYSYRGPVLHRAATHHRHNVDIAYRRLLGQGYRRIGLCLPTNAVEGVDANWLAGFLYWQWKLPGAQRVPLFVHAASRRDFLRWLDRHRPDAILSLTGTEQEWLAEAGRDVPGEIGLACLNRPLQSGFAGVEENHEAVGGAAVDIVVGQIQANERGLPGFPKVVLIEGTWREGSTLRPGLS